MDYLVIRPVKQHAYAIGGTVTLSDRLTDENLKRGAYVPLSDIRGLDEELIPGLTFQRYLDQNMDLLVREIIPVIRYTGKEWRIWMPVSVVARIRLAQFVEELEQFMLSYCAISDRIKINLEAEAAIYRLAKELHLDSYAIKAEVWKYLEEEEESGRCKLGGWEKFRQLAGSFLLRRLFPKLDQSEVSRPVILNDIRAVFNMVLLTRMLRQQQDLIDRYQKDVVQVKEIETLVDYYFPNPIKPR